MSTEHSWRTKVSLLGSQSPYSFLMSVRNLYRVRVSRCWQRDGSLWTNALRHGLFVSPFFPPISVTTRLNQPLAKPSCNAKGNKNWFHSDVNMAMEVLQLALRNGLSTVRQNTWKTYIKMRAWDWIFPNCLAEWYLLLYIHIVHWMIFWQAYSERVD